MGRLFGRSDSDPDQVQDQVQEGISVGAGEREAKIQR